MKSFHKWLKLYARETEKRMKAAERAEEKNNKGGAQEADGPYYYFISARAAHMTAYGIWNHWLAFSRESGAQGGAATTKAKREAARKNGKKGGRPKKDAQPKKK